jgi:hypothetical protein
VTKKHNNSFQIEEAVLDKAKGKIFSSLEDIIKHYLQLLQHPFKYDVCKSGLFHGDITSAEAEEMLREERDGTYLCRLSTVLGSLAMSFTQGKDVKHSLVELHNGGYRYINQRLYQNFRAMCTDHSEQLKFPLFMPSYRMRPKSATKIAFSNPQMHSRLAPSSLQSDSGYVPVETPRDQLE